MPTIKQEIETCRTSAAEARARGLHDKAYGYDCRALALTLQRKRLIDAEINGDEAEHYAMLDRTGVRI